MKERTDSLLDSLDLPRDLRGLDTESLVRLAGEIRGRIIQTVDTNGGHLGSNLGVVELAIALNKTFDWSKDRLLWDVSHQVYPHKLLTGRAPRFNRLRKKGGLSGFSNKWESPFDLFNAGHAGSAVSIGGGIAVADALSQRKGKTVVVVGDASCACGVTFEGLNYAGAERPNLLVILNDNRMSIARSVGALSQYLYRIRTKPFYRELVSEIHKTLLRIPLVGRQLDSAVERVHEAVRHTLVPGLIFQELGFKYYGPVEGHEMADLLQVLQDVRSAEGPVLLHVHTVKGRGYAPAASNPAEFHGCKAFLGRNGKRSLQKKQSPTYTAVFSKTLLELGRENERLCAVTAAMADGTGVKLFARKFPRRAFDVGISEAHGACFASGLSFAGKDVAYAIYSTFSQRAYDQVFHDICLQSNSLVLCLDRAGIVGEDGPTHHGVFDISLFRHLPSVVLAAPRDGRSLASLLRWALKWPQPVVLRYPRSRVPEDISPREGKPLKPGSAEVLKRGKKVAVFAYGSMVKEALKAAEGLDTGEDVTVVDARFAKPVDAQLLHELSVEHEVLITVEEHALCGGFGSAVLEEVSGNGIHFRALVRLGIPDEFVGYGSREELLSNVGLTADRIRRRIAEALKTFPESETRTQSRVNEGFSGLSEGMTGTNGGMGPGISVSREKPY